MILVADWLVSAIAFIFIGLLDTVAYGLVEVSYKIFITIADLSFFGGSVTEAMQLYNTFTQRVYTILSIVMVFFFAYQLLLLIANPDGDAKKKSGNIIKDTAISLIAIAVLPTVFRWMATFQHHVLTEGTITALVTGSSSSDGEFAGRNMALMTFVSMYHPEGTNYSFFIDKNGMRDKEDVLSDCTADSTTCETYYDALGAWFCNNRSSYNNCTNIREGTMATLTHNRSLSESIGNESQMQYMWILSTGCALLVAWFLLSYSLDMGARAIKLAFLELIAPIPLVMRIFPQTKGSYDKWFKEISKTYLDVFIRVLVVSFVIEIITLLPIFIDIIF